MLGELWYVLLVVMLSVGVEEDFPVRVRDLESLTVVGHLLHQLLEQCVWLVCCEEGVSLVV